MRGFLAMVQREVVERRMWLAAALVAGLMPLFAPLLPLGGAGTPAEGRGMMALVLAVSLMTAGSLALGLSMVGSDLAERRFGFYFARPLSAGAIWWGKLAGSFLIVMTAGVLAALPATLVGGKLVVEDIASLTASGPLLAVGGGVLVLLVLGLANILGVMGRSRSVWVILDLFGAVLVGGVIWTARERLMDAKAFSLLGWTSTTVLGCGLAILLAAGWAQVAVGRTDARAGHRALSITLWSGLGTLALALAAYAAWVLSAAPASIRWLREAQAAPGGSWALLSGRSPGRGDYEPTFLLDAETGRSLRLDARLRWWPHAPLFSADGKVAVWRKGKPEQVWFADLGAARPEVIATPIVLDPGVLALRLAPDGRRMFVLTARSLSVYSLPDGRQQRFVLAELPVGLVRMRPMTNDELWLGVWPGANRGWSDPVDATLWRLSLASGKIEQTGTLRTTRYRDGWLIPADPQGEFLLAFRVLDGRSQLCLHDVWTGEVIRSLVETADQALPQVSFLHDGRIVVGERPAGSGQPAHVRVFSRNGEEERLIELEPGHLWHFGGEAAPGLLVVSIGPDETWSWNAQRSGHAVLVDVDRGSVEKLPAGHVVVPGIGWGQPDRFPSSPGSGGALLFRTPEGRLARLDPSSRTFATVLDTRWE